MTTIIIGNIVYVHIACDIHMIVLFGSVAAPESNAKAYHIHVVKIHTCVWMCVCGGGGRHTICTVFGFSEHKMIFCFSVPPPCHVCMFYM